MNEVELVVVGAGAAGLWAAAGAARAGLDLLRDVRVSGELPREGPKHRERFRNGLPHLLVVDLRVAVREDVAQAREGRQPLPELRRDELLPCGLLRHARKSTLIHRLDRAALQTA